MTAQDIIQELSQLTRVSMSEGMETFPDGGIVEIETEERFNKEDKAKLQAWADAKGCKIFFYEQTQVNGHTEGYSVMGFFLDFNTYTRKVLEKKQTSRLGQMAYFWEVPMDDITGTIKDVAKVKAALIDRLLEKHGTEPKPIEVKAEAKRQKDKPVAAKKRALEDMDAEMQEALLEELKSKKLKWKSNEAAVQDIAITTVNQRPCLAFYLEDGQVVKYYMNSYKRYFDGIA